MCGILGQIRHTNRTDLIEPERFRGALDSMQHRGPDDSGIYQDDNFIFGHRRLSILDLSHDARQPMVSADGQLVLVFNGEIYNFRELRSELMEKGYQFKTQSDSEVLLAAYQHYGISMIDKLIGMFAFVIADRLRQTFYLARDRVGVKPLYYHYEAGVLTFSSEVAALLPCLKSTPSLSAEAMAAYFTFRYPAVTGSYFESIKVVEPAQLLTLQDGALTSRRYWNFTDKFEQQAESRPESFYLEQLQTKLESAVDYRLIADVSVGTFLSGGLDSSILSFLVEKKLSTKLRTYSVTVDDADCSEEAFIEQMAQAIGSQHTSYTLSGEDYFAELPKQIQRNAAPIAVPNEIALAKLAKIVKQNTTVMLSGEGADELFFGYGRLFRMPQDWQNYQSLNASDSSAFKTGFERKYGEKPKSFATAFLNAYAYMPWEMTSSLLQSGINADTLRSRFEEWTAARLGAANSSNHSNHSNHSNQLMTFFINTHLPGLLGRLDSATMAASVESRVPFTDHRLIEFAATVPAELKLKWNSESAQKRAQTLMSHDYSEQLDTTKYLLKKAYEKVLPKRIVARKKMGFPLPLQKWLDDTKQSALPRSHPYLHQSEACKNASGLQNWMVMNMAYFLNEFAQ